MNQLIPQNNGEISNESNVFLLPYLIYFQYNKYWLAEP